MIETPARRPYALKEPFCALSHYAGAVLSLAALAALLSAAQGRFWPTLGVTVFAVSLFTLYLASALSHTGHASPRVQDWLTRFDYIAIFLLIAGTYTPLCLVTLHGVWGWSLLAIEYGLAAVGIANIVFRPQTPHWLRVVLYVVMGWLIVAAWGPVQQALPPAALGWMVAGGLFYSVGVAILALDRPHLWPGRFSAHDLWHLFVIAGSACHFWLIYRYIAPSG